MFGRSISYVCFSPTQLHSQFLYALDTAIDLVLRFGVQLLVLRFCVIHPAEAIRKRITLSHQEVSGLVHLLANPGDFMVTLLLSDMAFPVSFQKFRCQLHDLDSLFSVCDRIAVLGNKHVLVDGTVEDMLKSEEPWVKSYFRGKRARQLDLAARA